MVEGFDGIVVGVETLELSRNAIAWAVQQAAADGSRVRLVHAVDWSFAGTLAPWGGEVPIELFPEQLRAAYQDELHKALAYARECGPGVEVDGEVRDGDPVTVLRDAAVAASMVVIGTRNLGAVKSALFGSTGSGLVHACRVPFVVVRGENPDDAAAPIVVGVEPTPAAEGVLAEAFRIAAALHRPLRAVSCWEPFYYAPHDPAHRSTASVREHAELWLAEAVAGWQEKYPDVHVEQVLLFDYAAAGLIEESMGAALLVVGIGGNRLQRLLGSVAGSVVHHAPCPVAVIPDRAGPDPS